MLIRENVPLASFTTMQVGGPSRYFAEAFNSDEVMEAVEFSREHKLPLFVLGGGSNLIIADRGWPGLTVKVGIGGIAERNAGAKILFDVGAGEEWDRFVAHAVARNCAGIECLSGIPGSVGGTPVQNVGAYGQQVSDTIVSVLVFDLLSSQTVELQHQACRFSYRSSIFNSSDRGRYIILRVTYALTSGGDSHIQYADLKKHFAGQNFKPTLGETRDAVRNIRAGKGMLIAPGDDDCRSAGSFFKNPVLADDEHRKLCALAEKKGLRIPDYPALEAQHKISAAWLVEHSGFGKGYGTGAAGISRKHALAIINRGQATAGDIVALKDEIQKAVLENWGIELQPEPGFVGF